LALDSIKSMLGVVPQWMKYPLLFMPFELICGKAYRDTLRTIEKYSVLNESQKKEFFDERLVLRLNDAINFVPFYRSFARDNGFSRITSPEEIKKFPIISKSELLTGLDLFVDERLRGRYFAASTGGTTGKQTKLYISNECFSKEWAYVNSLLASHGIDPNSKRISLRGVSGIQSGELIGYNYIYKELLLSPFKLSESSVLNNIKQLIDFKAKWIHGYPSSVSSFARILKNLGLRIPNIRGVLLVSETLYADQRLLIEEVFGSNIVSFYGMSERAVFATMARDGTFDVDCTYGCMENVDGEAVCTGFINRATSLLRYRTGDLIESAPSDLFVTKVKKFNGRWGREYLTGRSGCQITMTALNTHSVELDNLDSYQFVQSEIGIVNLNVKSKNKLTSSELEKISSIFQSKVGNELEFVCQQVDEILLTSRGKHVFIVNNIQI